MDFEKLITDQANKYPELQYLEANISKYSQWNYAKKIFAFCSDYLFRLFTVIKKELEEIVIIEFTVKRDGWIEDINIRKGKNAAFKKEARRLVREMPRWKPAEMEGKVVNETIILPIRFKLEFDD